MFVTSFLVFDLENSRHPRDHSKAKRRSLIGGENSLLNLSTNQNHVKRKPFAPQAVYLFLL